MKSSPEKCERLGGNFREREKIKRQRLTWTARFAAMPPARRQVIREALEVVDRALRETPVRSASQKTSIAAAIADKGDAARFKSICAAPANREKSGARNE
jgi:hypothetical protein